MREKNPIDPKRKWGAGQRQAFIDFRLYWEGRVNRSDLIETFGISPQQASADIQDYIEVAPDNVGYNRSGKYYHPAKDFSPKFISPDSRSYLGELLAAVKGEKNEGMTYLGYVPNFGEVPKLDRRVDPQILLAVLNAIRANRAIEVEYLSFTTPGPQYRWLSPHALGFDSSRWHVRAYCEERKDFRDFVLARITDVRREKEASIDPQSDAKWNTWVSVRIGPHPALSDMMRKRIAWDFGMEDSGERIIRVRAAMLFYFLMQMKLDHASEKLDPEAKQIVLLNPEEVTPYL